MSRSDQQKRSHQSSCSSEDESKNEDRKSVKKLTQREREAELLKRHEELERAKHHEEIRKRLKSQGKQSDSENESKKDSNVFNNEIYDADEAEPIERRSSTTIKSKNSSRDQILKQIAEDRNKKRISENERIQKQKDRPFSNGETTNKVSPKKLNVGEVFTSSSSSESSDSDDERSRSKSPKGKTSLKKITPISNRSELKSIVLSRFRMEKWCHAPFFAQVAKGAFARINIGQNNGAAVYRICEIRDVVETAKVYSLGSTRTNKGLRLKHADHERVFRLEFVSNKEISESEFRRWSEALKRKRISLPTLDFVEKKVREIDECKKKVLSHTDINKIISEKNRFRKAPINYAMKKNELMKEIENARETSDLRKEKEFKEKLDEIEKRASELDRRRTQNISAIAQINQRNRKKTQENIEMALIKQSLEQQDRAADPFTRRRCEPTLVTKRADTREDLVQKLKSERDDREAAEAVAKKKREEQRAIEKSKFENSTRLKPSEIHGKLPTNIDKGLTILRTAERGSFTSLIDKTDDLFNSHNFDLEVPIHLPSE